MPEVFIYYIKSYYTKPEDLDPALGVIDNSANERPDWYEYWPIRKFLLNESLDDNAFYAFLSPSFTKKTNLRPSAIYDFVRREGALADVILLSPSLHLTAYYWNVFKYGDYCHPGLGELATKFFSRIGQPTDLEDLVTHSGNEVYSNYFLAKPKFWRAWLQITEQLIAFAESPTDPLGEELRKKTTYRGHQDTQIKIFIMERIPTWILARSSDFTIRVRDPLATRSRLYKLPGAIVCDALKLAYVTTGRRDTYKTMFRAVSTLRKPLSALIRVGDFLRFPYVRSLLEKLGTYWTKAGRA